MKERQFINRLATCAIGVLMLGLTFNLSAQVVDMPDPNLQEAIRSSLSLGAGIPITVQDMLNLTTLYSQNAGISNLKGLEYAINLADFNLGQNPITDISPIQKLEKITGLSFWGCRITDISPLQNLRNLRGFLLGYNQIEDITPLSNLTNLEHVDLAYNRIKDYSPLANLVNLRRLDIQGNLGDNYTSLQNIVPNLTEFVYDEICDVPPSPPYTRDKIESRSFPSVFQAWDNVINLNHLEWRERLVLHDVHWTPRFAQPGLQWDATIDNPAPGVATNLAGDMTRAKQNHMWRLNQNPNMVFLHDIAVHVEASEAFFPPDSNLWLRDNSGNIIRKRNGDVIIDVLNPEVQELIVQRILAVERCGLYDGIFIDGFGEDGVGFVGRDRFPASQEDLVQAMMNILQSVRARVRDDFLIVVNATDNKPVAYADLINGTFMEVGKDMPEGYSLQLILELESILSWAESHLREPQVNCLEGQGMTIEPPGGVNNVRWMRMFTCLVLTHSNGYILYTSGYGHHHLWHSFWDVDLGQPIGDKVQLYENTDGLFIREFTNGWAVYNRSGKAQVIEFPEDVSSVTSGLTVANHAVLDLDGDMFLKVETKNPADVNGDGIVNILDLILVAQGIGTGELTADVNGDGVVNVFDLVFVANQF